MTYSGNPYMPTINSENTVKHDKQYQHKRLANIIKTETSYLFRLSQNLGEPGKITNVWRKSKNKNKTRVTRSVQ